MSSEVSDATPNSTVTATELAKTTDYVGAVSWLVSGISVFALFVLAILNQATHQSRWLVVLFALPLIGQTIGSLVLFHRPRGDKRLRTFHRFYLSLMILCIGSYFTMWLCYLLWVLKSSPVRLSTLSTVSLAAITFMVSMVVLMTLAILCPPSYTRAISGGSLLRRFFSRLIRSMMSILDNLRMGTSQEPFLALLLFFTAFLGISYLFGFTFAFHDKSLAPTDRGLYMRTSYMPGPVPEPTLPVHEVFRFDFDSSQAIPDVEENPPELQGAATDLKNIAERKSNNHRSLEAIVKYVSRIPHSEALRFIVIGHADDVRTDGVAYQSNYELSQARAENVRHRILQRLNEGGDYRWRNIEWLCLSKSSEVEASRLADVVQNASGTKSGRNGLTKPVISTVSEERFVEVQINRQFAHATSVQMDHLRSDGAQDLALMDYIYFANYTITTTGYGDIIPLTPYSKFVCSLANICEVFFLVVFFNALLSVKQAITSTPQPK